MIEKLLFSPSKAHNCCNRYCRTSYSSINLSIHRNDYKPVIRARQKGDPASTNLEGKRVTTIDYDNEQARVKCHYRRGKIPWLHV